MNLRPLHDRVIVRRLDNETEITSSIVIPDAAAEESDQGEMLAADPGKKDDKGNVIALDIKVDDRVLFDKCAGQSVKVGSREVLVIHKEDIATVVQR